MSGGLVSSPAHRPARTCLADPRRLTLMAVVKREHCLGGHVERSAHPYLGERLPGRGARRAGRPGRSHGEDRVRGALSRLRRYLGDGR